MGLWLTVYRDKKCGVRLHFDKISGSLDDFRKEVASAYADADTPGIASHLDWLAVKAAAIFNGRD